MKYSVSKGGVFFHRDSGCDARFAYDFARRVPPARAGVPRLANKASVEGAGRPGWLAFHPESGGIY